MAICAISGRVGGFAGSYRPNRPDSSVDGLLHSGAAFGIALAVAREQSPPLGCGCSSVVEHDLAKVGVEGSNPFARSRFFNLANFDEGPLPQRAFRFAAEPSLTTSSRDARPA